MMGDRSELERLREQVENQQHTIHKIAVERNRLLKMLVHCERENGRLLELNRQYLEQARSLASA